MVTHNSLIVKTNKSGRYIVRSVVVMKRNADDDNDDDCNKIRVAAQGREKTRNVITYYLWPYLSSNSCQLQSQ